MEANQRACASEASASPAGTGLSGEVLLGSFCISPGRKNEAGEKLLEALMPPQPEPAPIMASVNASHSKILFKLT
jgi:hypothetical protein